MTSGHPPSRLNGSSLENHLENDGFSDKSERENAEESDNETQDHSRKTESGSDRSEAPAAGPVRRGTTYVEQVHEELGEVSRPAWSRGIPLRLAPHPRSSGAAPSRPPGSRCRVCRTRGLGGQEGGHGQDQGEPGEGSGTRAEGMGRTQVGFR